MGVFKNNNDMNYSEMPLYDYDDTEIYYVPSLYERVRDWIKNHLTITFIIIGALLVGLTVLLVSLLATNNNPVSNFVKASSNLIYSGGFDFDVSVTYDGKQYLKYDGGAEFNQTTQEINAAYKGVYPEYEYENYTYTHRDKVTHFGNYYNERWAVTEDTHLVTDFYDFLRDYKDGNFDGNAYMSFFNKTGEFVPTELNSAMSRIMSKLSAGSDSILHCETYKRDGNLTYVFNPEMDKVVEIFVDNNKSAFNSADTYMRYKEEIEANLDNLKNAQLTVEYTVDENNCLIEFHSDLNSQGKNYKVDAVFTNIGNPTVKIPVEFFEKCKIDIKDVKEKYIAD